MFRVQQCTDQNHMVREGIQKYIDEHNATLNEDDVRDFIDDAGFSVPDGIIHPVVSASVLTWFIRYI